MNDQVINGILVGILAGALFTFGVGFWRQGILYGLACAMGTGAAMIILLLPLWLVLINIGLRLT